MKTLPYVNEIMEERETIDRIMVMLNNMFEQNRTMEGGNSRCARLAKDVYQGLDAVVKVVEELDRLGKSY